MRTIKAVLFLLLLAAVPASGQIITDQIECSQIQDTVTISVAGTSRVFVELETAFSGGCTIVSEASLDGTVNSYQPAPLYRGSAPAAEVSTVNSLNSGNTTLGSDRIWVFDNPGFNFYRLRVSVGGSPGSTTLSMWQSDLSADPRVPNARQHPTAFACTMTSTATTLADIAGCGAPPFGSRYITGIQWGSSIISTTTNFMLFRAGSNANCGSGTVDVWRDFSPTAFGGDSVVFNPALKLPLGFSLCFIHPGAGTRFINIQGFVAP